MSVWDDIKNAVNSVPGAGEVNKIGSEVGKDIGKQVLPFSGFGKNPVTVGSLGNTIGKDLGSLGHLSGSSAPLSPADTQTNDILNSLSGLTFGQEMGSGASGLAKQLVAELQNLPAADAEKIISKLTGTTLGSDIATDLNPPAATAPGTGAYGYDPLSLGQAFQTTLAPYLNQVQQETNKEDSSLASQIQGALGKASPGIQQAFSVGVPALEMANNNANSAAANSLATAPQWDNLIQQLTNSSNAFKLAQQEYALEPYIASTTTGAPPPAGSPGSATSGTAGQTQLAAMLAAIQAGQ